MHMSQQLRKGDIYDRGNFMGRVNVRAVGSGIAYRRYSWQDILPEKRTRAWRTACSRAVNAHIASRGIGPTYIKRFRGWIGTIGCEDNVRVEFRPQNIGRIFGIAKLKSAVRWEGNFAYSMHIPVAIKTNSNAQRIFALVAHVVDCGIKHLFIKHVPFSPQHIRVKTAAYRTNKTKNKTKYSGEHPNFSCMGGLRYSHYGERAGGGQPSPALGGGA